MESPPAWRVKGEPEVSQQAQPSIVGQAPPRPGGTGSAGGVCIRVYDTRGGPRGRLCAGSEPAIDDCGAGRVEIPAILREIIFCK